MKTAKKMCEEFNQRQIVNWIERLEKSYGYLNLEPKPDYSMFYSVPIYYDVLQPTKNVIIELEKLGYKIKKHKGKYPIGYIEKYKIVDKYEGFWIFRKLTFEEVFDKYVPQEKEFEWISISACCGEENENNKE